VAVFAGVMLAGFFGVLARVVQMALCDVGMMAGLLMIPGFMMFGGSFVVLRGVFVMFRSFAVMLRGLFGHVELSLYAK